MALKTLSFLMIPTLLVAASSLFGVSTAFGGRKALAPGSDAVALPPAADFDFVPLNTRDPKVLDLATYAINEYNKETNSKLVLLAVLEATYTNSDKGTNYGLVLEATNSNKELNDYEVNVLVDKDVKKLTAFKKDE